MTDFIHEETKLTRLSNALSKDDGTTKTSRVDMKGWDGVRFILAAGTIDATGTVTLKAAQAATDANGVELSGLSAQLSAGHDNCLAHITVLNPTDRYVQAWIVRATASSVIDGLIAEQFRGRSLAASDDATTVPVSDYAVTPDEV